MDDKGGAGLMGQILKISFKGTDTFGIFKPNGKGAKLIFEYPGRYGGNWWDIDDWANIQPERHTIEEISEDQLERLKAEFV